MRCLAAALILGMSGTAQANNTDLLTQAFDPETKLEVEFIDQVSDGCLPRPAAVQAAIELQVRRAGLRVSDDPESAFPWTILVTASGYEMTLTANTGWQQSGGCVVMIDLYLMLDGYFERLKLDLSGDELNWINQSANWLTITVWTDSYLLNGEKTTMQDRVRAIAVERVDVLLNNILRAIQSPATD